ncbi:MAG: 6-carboxytetrahydropterin synthase, partial [Candidatus Omnitrophica bacterium]|nr:6-carboxytetrahydropterin synthase [Candidatus Omnitrophota bacterium]
MENNHLFLTRRYSFCCSHRLHNPRLSSRKNKEVYEECNNRFGHGHDYILEVTAKGRVDSLTGMSVDLRVLDRFVRREVIRRYDHKHLNIDVPDFKGIVPTGENILR